MKHSMRTAGIPAVLLGLVMGVTGCSTTMRDLPIPGTGVSGDTIEVVAEFDDAVNLASGALVKVNGVDSGKVTEIDVEDYTALVTMTVREDAEIREGATARLRYTTPLGEIFVDVRNPGEGPVLVDNAVLAMQRTDTAPSVEDALSSASLLINGGGLEQLQTVTEELNTILGGNEDDIKALLRNANGFLTQANQTTGAIDRTLNSLNSVSRTLTDREELFNRVIQDIRPAARLLREKTPEITRLLAELEQFSSVANETVNATRTQLLALLSEVQPVLAELASNRNRMNTMLKEIAKAGDVVALLSRGDYLPLGVDLVVDGSLEGGLIGTLEGILGTLDLGGSLLDTDGLGGLLRAPSTQDSSPAGLRSLVNGGGN